MSRRNRLLAAVAALFAMLVPAATAHASMGGCLPGHAHPRCHIWTGRVGSINDGDTFRVHIRGVGYKNVRFLAVQAMELIDHRPHHKTGQCYSREAYLRVAHLVRKAHRRVRLTAFYPSSHANQHRLLRGIFLRLHGKWVDLGEKLIREGYTIAMPNEREWSENKVFIKAEQEARLDGKNMWDPQHCGKGPQQDQPIEVWVQSDPLGIDSADINGEWVKIFNHGATPLRLGHWWVRDAMTRRFTFPAGTQVAPGGQLTVHVGHGTDSPGVFYWGLNKPIFDNNQDDGHWMGDGAYLFDPDGDLRAEMLYPCLVDCHDPRQGALTIAVDPKHNESIRVTNVSGGSVSLFGLELALGGSTYEFPSRAALGGGRSLTVDVLGDPHSDTPTHLHWGAGRHMLPDSGGSMSLMTYSRITLDCDAWGSGSCS